MTDYPMQYPTPAAPVGAVPNAAPPAPEPVGPPQTAFMPPLPTNWRELGQPVLRYKEDGTPYMDFVSVDPLQRKLADEYDPTDDPEIPMIAHVDADGVHHRVKVRDWAKYEVRNFVHFGKGGKYRFV